MCDNFCFGAYFSPLIIWSLKSDLIGFELSDFQIDRESKRRMLLTASLVLSGGDQVNFTGCGIMHYITSVSRVAEDYKAKMYNPFSEQLEI